MVALCAMPPNASLAEEADEDAADMAADMTGAPAGGLVVTAGAELAFTFPSEGTTQELSGYVEAETNGFYGGLWALVSKESAANEVDLYLGYRAEGDTGFSYDVNYTRFFYPNDGGDCCGEIGLSLGQPINAALGVTLDLTYDPDASIGTATVGAAYALNEKLSVSANYGLVDLGPPAREREWDLGVTYGLGEASAVDLRYYDGSDVDGYVGLSLTYDTTLFGG
jgi:uncharacterized protein (TIGR02001 family)